MKRQIKKGVIATYRIVRKFSSLIEAQLALELLNLYHIKARMVQNYQDAQEQVKSTMDEIVLLVLPHDYPQAHQLLLAPAV